ncbi:MAG TPA: winged helix-turn-helix domain-containing protein [Anaerolineae bacterium]|nr:winged helix-turn-helix domain-containing protein [Anaerolineae bacterium]
MESIKARFFGRKTIIADLVPGLLAPSQPLDFSLVGPKLIGKSRLLKYLADETGPLHGPDPYGWRPERFRGGHNIIVGHYDCDWPAAKAHLTEFISQRLAAQLQEEGHRHFDLDWERINSATSPGQRIGQMVRQLDQRQIRLVLLLDNFDHVLRSKHVTPDMVNELRPLTNELGLVVATEEALHDLNQSIAASPLFNVMHQHFVGLLEPEGAQTWIETYKELANFTPEVGSALLDMAGGHPFLLARVNDILLETQSLLPGIEVIDQEQIPLISLRLAEHGRQLFELNWHKLNEAERVMVKPLVKQLIKAPILIGQLPVEQVTALNWLINQAIVSYYRNTYQIFSPLFQKFLIDKEQKGLFDDTPPVLVVTHSEKIYDQLTPKEAELLRYFEANSHTVISIETLLADVWNQPEASPRRVQEAIRRLRNNLAKYKPAPGVIENERGEGYRYVPNAP